MDVARSACSVTPIMLRALAAKFGQKHTGNITAIFISLERKGFIKLSERNKNMFRVIGIEARK